MYTATERWFLTPDRKRAVPESDPDARFLLVGAGGQIDDDAARRYGLLPARSTEQPKTESPLKAMLGPPENKATIYAPEAKRGPGRPRKSR